MGVDVLSAYQAYVAVTKALPAHYFSVSPALVITPLSLSLSLSLPGIPTNSPLLKILGYRRKQKQQQQKETDLCIQPRPLSCIASSLNYHLASTYPERPGPIHIARAAALHYREQAADAKEECSESEV